MAFSGRIEILPPEGKPENFLGIDDMSSGDKGSIKYNGTEEMEDELSSVHMASGNVKAMSKSSNQDFEDIMKGGLKSSKGKFLSHHLL